jgi:hypothetical protein
LRTERALAVEVTTQQMKPLCACTDSLENHQVARQFSEPEVIHGRIMGIEQREHIITETAR